MTRLAFTECDPYAEAVRVVSVRMRMFSRQASQWTLHYATVGSLFVQQGFEGGGSIAVGVNGSDAWSFYFQSHPGCANGQVLNKDEVFAVMPGGEFAWLANQVTNGSPFIFQPASCFHRHQSWSSHPSLERNS